MYVCCLSMGICWLFLFSLFAPSQLCSHSVRGFCAPARYSRKFLDCACTAAEMSMHVLAAAVSQQVAPNLDQWMVFIVPGIGLAIIRLQKQSSLYRGLLQKRLPSAILASEPAVRSFDSCIAGRQNKVSLWKMQGQKLAQAVHLAVDKWTL